MFFTHILGVKDGQNGRAVQGRKNLGSIVKPQNTYYLGYPITWLGAFLAACGVWAANLIEGSLEEQALTFD